MKATLSKEWKVRRVLAAGVEYGTSDEAITRPWFEKANNSLARASTRVKLRVVRNFILLVSVKLWVNSFEAHCQSLNHLHIR